MTPPSPILSVDVRRGAQREKEGAGPLRKVSRCTMSAAMVRVPSSSARHAEHEYVYARQLPLMSNSIHLDVSHSPYGAFAKRYCRNLMEISFVATHKSVKSFPKIEAPSFVLLTGVNGSGKTHLLQAIQGGQVKVDIAPKPKDGQVRYFDWNSLVPPDQPAFDSHQNVSQLSDFYRQLVEARQPLVEALYTAATRAGVPPDALTSVEVVASFDEQQLTDIMGGDAKKAKIAADSIAALVVESRAGLLQRLGSNSRGRIIQIAQEVGRSVLALREQDFYSDTMPNWGRVDGFRQAFGQLFATYRGVWLKNQVKALRASKGERINFLSDLEFDAQYGPPPWDFVNEAMARAGLDFEIDRPFMYDDAPYQPILKKKTSGATIRFVDLSSGEKILMSMALCVYYSKDKRQLASYPKLILFDEIDAPLHPSMVQNFIQIITDVLVDEI